MISFLQNMEQPVICITIIFLILLFMAVFLSIVNCIVVQGSRLINRLSKPSKNIFLKKKFDLRFKNRNLKLKKLSTVNKKCSVHCRSNMKRKFST